VPRRPGRKAGLRCQQWEEAEAVARRRGGAKEAGTIGRRCRGGRGVGWGRAAREARKKKSRARAVGDGEEEESHACPAGEGGQAGSRVRRSE
jgi:hypothetical protein